MKFPGRNELCHCNSGKKYKKCCLEKDEEKALQDRLIKSDSVLPTNNTLTSETSLEKEKDIPEIQVQEDENITRIWNEINELNYPDDALKGITIIELFIRDFPNLAEESGVIDELFIIEEHLFNQNRINEYIMFLERIQEIAPEYYEAEFAWFDIPRLCYAVDNKQMGMIESLLINFKKNPVESVGNLCIVIDLLAWTGAEKELENLLFATYKQLADSDKILNNSFVTNWIYFYIYIRARDSTLLTDDCTDKIIQLLRNTFDISDTEYDRDFIKRTIKWIRDDTFEWECPFGNDDAMIDFYICMEWQAAKHICKYTNVNITQARYMEMQLYAFWMEYRAQKRPKSSIYFITEERIRKFALSQNDIRGVAFLQAVWYFADYLHMHEKINTQTRNDLQKFTREMYCDTFKSHYIYYPACKVITDFPVMVCNNT